MNWLIAFLLIFAVLPIAYLGLGVLCCRGCKERDIGIVSTLVVGISAMVSLGGILNLLRLAYAWPIGLVILVGFIVGVYRLTRCSVKKTQIFAHRATILLVVTAALFAAITQLRPDVFNHADDFTKYFSHPVRMLQTGTISGSALSAIGFETLGGHAVLQAPLAALVPIQYINGLDAVLGYTLCLCFAARSRVFTGTLGTVIPLMCVVAVVLIDPAYVNVSGLYIPALLVMGSIENGQREAPNFVLSGLMYAALIAVKSTMIVFVGVHMAMVMARGLLTIETRTRWRLMMPAFATAGFVSPWILLHLGAYAKSQTLGVPDGGSSQSEFHLFSAKKLAYGSSTLNYTMLVGAMVVWALLYVWSKRFPKSTMDRGVLTSVMSIAGVYAVVLWFMAPLSGHSTAIRFFAPIAIGSFSPILANIMRGFPPNGWYRVAVFSSAFLVLASFGRSWHTRLINAATVGSILPFRGTGSPDYARYNQFVLSDDAKTQLKVAQSFVPPGEPFVAWVNYPFYFDFSRNRVFDIDVAGLATPWAGFPRVRYIVWHRVGFSGRSVEAVEEVAKLSAGARERMVGVRTLAAIRVLTDAVNRGKLLYENNGLCVYRIPELGEKF